LEPGASTSDEESKLDLLTWFRPLRSKVVLVWLEC